MKFFYMLPPSIHGLLSRKHRLKTSVFNKSGYILLSGQARLSSRLADRWNRHVPEEECRGEVMEESRECDFKLLRLVISSCLLIFGGGGQERFSSSCSCLCIVCSCRVAAVMFLTGPAYLALFTALL